MIFDRGSRLEPLNSAHPEVVALITGPVVLFPVGDAWTIKASDREVRLTPFAAIHDETYRLYSVVKA